MELGAIPIAAPDEADPLVAPARRAQGSWPPGKARFGIFPRFAAAPETLSEVSALP